MAAKIQYNPGPPPPTPEQRLLLMDDEKWEQFIEACAMQMKTEGVYKHVIRLGGSGDKGRDVCGYTTIPPTEGTWDLYQAKYYSGALAPNQFAPEVAKFLWSVHSQAYSCPRAYYVCALKIGPKLTDLLLNPDDMRDWIIKEWKEKNGDFGQFKQPLSDALANFVEAFHFGIMQRRTPLDLLDVHSRNASRHWSEFGVLAERDPNPDVPEAPASDEAKYIGALLEAYAEKCASPVTDVQAIPPTYRKHFRAQRRLFYCAEGLNRFSRDKLPGAFDDLLDQLERRVGFVVAAPYVDGFERLQATLLAAGALQLPSSPLHARLDGGDLPGSCHHLANLDRLRWVSDDEE